MSDGAQFDLFGAPAVPAKRPKPPPFPQGRDRLLFALYPDPEAAQGIARQGAALRAALGLRGAARPTEVLHITLRHVGDLIGPPREMVERLLEALAGFEFEGFDVRLDSAMRFVGAGAFVLLASEEANRDLIDFRRVLCGRLDAAGAGWRVGGGAFTPHVTLSYEDREVPSRPIDPIVWRVREFVLVHSLLGQTRHTALARFPLA